MGSKRRSGLFFRSLLIISAIIILLGLILTATMPASLVRDITGAGADLPLRQVRGTPWRGSADYMQPEHGPVTVRWSWQPPANWDWTAAGDGVDLVGAFAPGTRMHAFDHVTGEVAIERFDVAEWLPGIRADGTVDVALADIHITEGRITAVSGDLVWRDARLTGAANADLGRVRARFTDDSGGLTADLESLAPAEVSVDGRIHVSDETYAIDVWLQPAADRPDLARALKPFGQVQPDGRIRITHEGRLMP